MKVDSIKEEIILDRSLLLLILVLMSSLVGWFVLNYNKADLVVLYLASFAYIVLTIFAMNYFIKIKRFIYKLKQIENRENKRKKHVRN